MTIKGKKVFITGGAGFIASHICERLIAHNHITVYDNKERNALKYTTLLRHPHLRFIEGDVLDAAHLKKAMTGSDVVIHCAAIAGIYSVVKSPTLTLKVNFLGTYHALEAAVHHRIKRFIDFSTSEVYGPYVYKGTENDLTSQGPVSEGRWSYAVSKLAAEHLTHSYHKEYGLAITTLRPFNVYGPRQVGEGAIRGIVLNAIKNHTITLYNDGTQVRAWCYIDDFVDGLMAVLESPKAIGQTFNLGNPQGSITNLELAKMIKRLSESKSKIIFRKHPGPEVQIRVPSISRAGHLLKFRPKISLEEGIVRTIAWYRDLEKRA